MFLSPYIYKSVSGSVNLDIAISSAWTGWDKTSFYFLFCSYLIIVALCWPFPVPYWQYWSAQVDHAPNQKDITFCRRQLTRNRCFEFVDVCTAGTTHPSEIRVYPLVVVSNRTDRYQDQCWNRTWDFHVEERPNPEWRHKSIQIVVRDRLSQIVVPLVWGLKRLYLSKDCFQTCDKYQ